MKSNLDLVAFEYGQRIKRYALVTFGIPLITVGLISLIFLVPNGMIAETAAITFFGMALSGYAAFKVYAVMKSHFSCPACGGKTKEKAEKGDSTINLNCDSCGRRWSIGLTRPDENIP